MDIAGYMCKKKLLGAKKSNMLKYNELFVHKSDMDLIEALALEKEAIFRIKINKNEEVILRDSVDEPLEKNVSVFIDKYTTNDEVVWLTDNDEVVWLTDLVLRQNTPYNDFNLRIDLLVFDNGKKIAIRNYGNIMIYPVKVDTLGYCIEFKVIYHGYFKAVIIDNELNKYLCVSSEMSDYNKWIECRELSMTYKYDNSYKLRIIEKIDKISMEQIKEIEIVY